MNRQALLTKGYILGFIAEILASQPGFNSTFIHSSRVSGQSPETSRLMNTLQSGQQSALRR